ncbi:hypothetical protein VW35_17000 [Devosia soli]|uniref:Phosphoribulokinase/uridine kinase domain-containing protein n=1 Tax=Devosia soli TaxID=361041 RepID=A0A0F5L2R2_9HYPH|nr:hypothetical protein [Devosia soli]KKB76494.1 hypothetical protein VW35_17000 [Devosia soli]
MALQARHSVRVLDATEAIRAAAGSRLIAIDGLPVSGKSTLADRMIEAIGAQAVYLDDFVKPEAQWRGSVKPSFPFPYIRYDDFLNTVKTLHRDGSCSYFPYDWGTGRVAEEARHITLAQPVIIEGVSSLHPNLKPLYDTSFWVESDARSTLKASLERGVGDWAGEWRHLFMPCVDLYLGSNPKDRADHIVKGRGYLEMAAS